MKFAIWCTLNIVEKIQKQIVSFAIVSSCLLRCYKKQTIYQKQAIIEAQNIVGQSLTLLYHLQKNYEF